MELALLAALNAERAARRACVVVTEIATGAQALVREADLANGGLAPAQALAEAFRSGRSGMIEADGRALLLTAHMPPLKLVVIGAVHVSQALAPIARALDLDMVVIDPRTAFATPERFAGILLIAAWPDEALATISLDRYTAFVALTHDPKIDDPALLAALASECFYIGALGSRKTHAKRLMRLGEAGAEAAALGRIRAPIGLNIGAVSPAEIALSIAGEIIATVRAERVAAKAVA
jgi:xanthine dehydrogenase accessory factor